MASRRLSASVGADKARHLPDQTEARAHIFISYSRIDAAFVYRLERALVDRGFSVMVDRSGISVFEDWWRRIEQLIVKADTIIFVLSPDAVKSRVCRQEVAFAGSLSKRFAPLVCRPVEIERIPDELRRLNFLNFDAETEFDQSLEKLTLALATNLEWIRMHTEVGELALRWCQAGRLGRGGLLLRSPLLEEAEVWSASRPSGAPLIGDDSRAFIAASRRADTKRRTTITTSLGGGLLIATILAGLALWQRNVAKNNEGIAQEQTRVARENESRSLAALSRIASKDGSQSGGTGLALAAWPRDERDPRPRLDATLDSLALSLSTLAPVIDEFNHPGLVRGALWDNASGRVFSWADDKLLRIWDSASGQHTGVSITPSGAVGAATMTNDAKRILVWADDGAIRIIDAESGLQVGAAMGHEAAVIAATFNSKANRILSWSSDRTLRLWDMSGNPNACAQLKPERLTAGALFSASGEYVLSWSGEDHKLWVWTTKDCRPVSTPVEQPGGVAGALFAEGRQQIVSWSDDGTLRRWDLRNGQQIGSPMAHKNGVLGASLMKDGRRLLSWSLDGSIGVWNLDTGHQIGRLLQADSPVLSANPSTDQNHVLAGYDDGTVRLWDLRTGQLHSPLMKHDGSVRGAVLTADDSRILSWSDDGTARLWDAGTGAQLGLPMRMEGSIGAALLSADGRRLLAWSSSGPTVRVWDVAVGRQAASTIRHGKKVVGAIPLDGGKRAVSWSDDDSIRVWSLTTGVQIGRVLKQSTPLGAHLFRDEGRLLSWSQDGTMVMWDLAAGQQICCTMKLGEVRWSPGIGPEGNDVFVDPEESRIVSSTTDVRQWDVKTGKQIGPAMPCRAMLAAEALSKMLLCPEQDGSIRLLDQPTNTTIASIHYPSFAEDNLVVNMFDGTLLTRDERRLLAWSRSKEAISMWDLRTGSPIFSPIMDAGGDPQDGDGGGPHPADAARQVEHIVGAAMDEAELRILSWSSTGRLSLWNSSTGMRIGRPMRHDGWVVRAVFSKDGTRILSWSVDGTVRLWNAVTGTQIGPPMNHEGPVRGAVFGRTETRIVSWSDDGSVRLWDVATGREIGPPMRHEAAVTGVFLLEDRDRVVSWSSDGSIRVWDVGWRGDDLLQIACNYSPASHDLKDLARRYGVAIAEPVCQEGHRPPSPRLEGAAKMK